MIGNLTRFGVIPRGYRDTVAYGPLLIYFTTRHVVLGVTFGELAAWVLARHAAVGVFAGTLGATRAMRHAITQEWFNLSEYVSVTDATFAGTSVTFNLNVLAAIPFGIDALEVTIDDWATSELLTDLSVGAHSMMFTSTTDLWSIVVKVRPKRAGVVVGASVEAEMSYYEYSSGDPYWANVVLLAGFDSGAVVDEGPVGQTMTTIGSVAFDHDNSFLGSPYAINIKADGTTDSTARVTTNGPNFKFGTAPFTIEGFAKAHSLATSGSRAMLGNAYNTVDYYSWTLEHRADGKLVFRTLHYDAAKKFTLTSSGARAAGVGFHFAVTRDTNNDLRLFIDGVLDTTLNIGTLQVNGTYNNIPLSIGSNQLLANYHGFFDELRITKGICRYTTGFAVPTIPYPRGA